MAEVPHNPFWAFSLAVYARPGVPPACLELQDRRGIDVNLLLFAAWAGIGCGVALTAERLAALDAAVAGWRRDMVQPLRAIRRRAKGEDEALYRRMKAAELEAERVQQDRLFTASGLDPQAGGEGEADRRALAMANMALLLPGGDPALDALVAALGLAARTDGNGG